MAFYTKQAKHFIRKFQAIKVKKIGQDGNSHTDALAWLGSLADSRSDCKIWVKYVPQPTVSPPNSVLYTDLDLSWMDPLIAFLKKGTLLDDKK